MDTWVWVEGFRVGYVLALGGFFFVGVVLYMYPGVILLTCCDLCNCSTRVYIRIRERGKGGTPTYMHFYWYSGYATCLIISLVQYRNPPTLARHSTLSAHLPSLGPLL
jgi:hypothetical protein